MVWVMAKRDDKLQVSMIEAVRAVGETLMEHWIWSNVYTVRQQNIQLQVKQLYLEFRGLLYKTKSKQTQFWREAHLLPFLEKIQKGLDIGTTDKNYLSKMEEKYGVKMTEEALKFLAEEVQE